MGFSCGDFWVPLGSFLGSPGGFWAPQILSEGSWGYLGSVLPLGVIFGDIFFVSLCSFGIPFDTPTLPTGRGGGARGGACGRGGARGRGGAGQGAQGGGRRQRGRGQGGWTRPPPVATPTEPRPRKSSVMLIKPHPFQLSHAPDSPSPQKATPPPEAPPLHSQLGHAHSH